LPVRDILAQYMTLDTMENDDKGRSNLSMKDVKEEEKVL